MDAHAIAQTITVLIQAAAMLALPFLIRAIIRDVNG